MRWRLGSALSRLATWLMYPPQDVCQKPGCGYVRGGVHDPVDECQMCRRDPTKRGEHHAFVSAPWWRRIGVSR